MQKILVIDDDRDLCFLLKQFLGRKGYDVSVVYSGEEALGWLESSKPDLIICDLRLEDIDGITLLGKVQEKYAGLPVIIITGHADIKTSALALKQGAFDYVMKPLLTEQILITIQEALNNKQEHGADFIKQYNADKEEMGIFFWGSPDTSGKLLKQLKLVAPTEYNVIIYGEDGTGKKSIAYEIHKKSNRADKSFVIVKSGALPKENPEEALFGLESENADGNQIKKGLLEEANGGTLFIAEAEGLPLHVQETLLKYLQKKKMRRVGGSKDIALDLRVIISANKLLWNATRNGKFKEELYHKLNDFNITISPLRQRKEDILAFADHFLRMNSEAFNKKILGFSPEALLVIKNHAWPDNIRELKNVIKKAVLLSKTEYIGTDCLPVEIVIADEAAPVKEQVKPV